jgi:hypothetical protein
MNYLSPPYIRMPKKESGMKKKSDKLRRVGLRLTESERKQLQVQADKYFSGNVSVFLRRAIGEYVPTK